MTGINLRLGKLEAANRNIGRPAEARAALGRWLAASASEADYRTLTSPAYLAHLSDNEISGAIEATRAGMK